MGREKLAGWIVRLRYPLMILVLALAVISAPNILKTRINYSLTDYLNEKTLTKRGLDIMNQLFSKVNFIGGAVILFLWLCIMIRWLNRKKKGLIA